VCFLWIRRAALADGDGRAQFAEVPLGPVRRSSSGRHRDHGAGLTFLFGFGHVLSLALRLGVSVWVAPLVAPGVDLSILVCYLAIRHLALNGATPAHARSCRRLTDTAFGRLRW
jgi:hypothetical protein